VRRRQFITLLGGAAVAWPIAARAQQPAKQLIVGFLGATTHADGYDRAAAFVQRLRELGWVEGRDLIIVIRWADGRSERFTEIASEFVAAKVDVIVTYATPAVAAVKQATSVIPIVFAAAADPVGTGLVASLARPGGNVTGLSLQTTDIAGKRLELLREVAPDFRRLAIMARADIPNAVLEMDEVQAAARKLGLDVVRLEIRQQEDIASAFQALKGRADALYVVLDPLISSQLVRISTLALGARLPTLLPFRAFVEAGGLISYAPDQTDLFRRAGDYVDKILRGAKPADLPVEQPTKFEFVVNLKTAKTLGIDVPPTLLARADEVIE
jgi:putative ABC transport system substrate-binding protein